MNYYQNIIENGLFKFMSIVNSYMISPFWKQGVSLNERLNVKNWINSLLEK
jgi:hypothetical protein